MYISVPFFSQDELTFKKRLLKKTRATVSQIVIFVIFLSRMKLYYDFLISQQFSFDLWILDAYRYDEESVKRDDGTWFLNTCTDALLFATWFFRRIRMTRVSMDGFDKFYKFNREKLAQRIFNASSLFVIWICVAIHRDPTTTAFRFPRRDPSLIARFLAFFSEARERSCRARRAAHGAPRPWRMECGRGESRRVPASPRRSTHCAVCYGYTRTRARIHSVGLSGAHTSPRRKRRSFRFLGNIFESSHEIEIGFRLVSCVSRLNSFKIYRISDDGRRALESGIITRLFKKSGLSNTHYLKDKIAT